MSLYVVSFQSFFITSGTHVIPIDW